MAPLAVVLGLSAALQAERPGLPVRAALQDALLSRDTLPENCVYVGRGSFHHRLQVTKLAIIATPPTGWPYTFSMFARLTFGFSLPS